MVAPNPNFPIPPAPPVPERPAAIGNGGPAFPLNNGHTGMTMRDYFAGQALNSLHLSFHVGPDGTTCRPVAAEFAAYAYEVADAMLAARKKGGA